MLSIVIKLIVGLIADKNRHDFYELHRKYRLTPAEIKEAVKLLETHEIVVVEGNEFWLAGELNGDQIYTIYESIKNRSLELDKAQLERIRENSQPINELYYPKLKIIDDTLLMD
jgi:hypothetical protein